MSSNLCTKEVILSLIDDIELIAREMLENCVAPKPKRMSGSDHAAITQLLVEKDKALQAALKVAAEQGEVEQKIEQVRAQVEEQDAHIHALQGQLKEAETLLSSTIYQAKQKMESIAASQPVPSEDLIKYSHKISASNAVAAPLNWQQGDPRRPYPTDIEMRGGFLGRLELPMSQQLQHATAPIQPQQPTSGAPPASSGANTPFSSPAAPPPPTMPSPGRAGGLHPGQSPSRQQQGQMAGQFGWNSMGELGMQTSGGGQIHIETGRDHGDAEVMSTDSSSSSSTDSN